MLWKIMFDIVLTKSVRVLLRLGGASKKKMCRNKKLFKNSNAYLSWQKNVIVASQNYPKVDKVA